MILIYRDLSDYLDDSEIPDESTLSTKRERFYYFPALDCSRDPLHDMAFDKFLDKPVKLSDARTKYIQKLDYKTDAMAGGWLGKFEIDQLIAVKQANKDSGINTDF